MNGRSGRALAGHYQRGLAGESSVEHVADFGSTAASRKPEPFDRIFDDGAFARPCVAENPEYLLLLGPVLKPILDRNDRRMLALR
jgi:hypothetical protein